MKIVEGPISFEGGVLVANECLGTEFPLVLDGIQCSISLPVLSTYSFPDQTPPWTAHIEEPRWFHESIKPTVYSIEGKSSEVHWGTESSVKWGADGSVVGGTSRVRAARFSFQAEGDKEDIEGKSKCVMLSRSKWWSNVRSWIEVLSLQRLTEQDGRSSVQASLMNHFWTDFGDGSEMIRSHVESYMNFGFLTRDFTRSGLQKVFDLATTDSLPDQSWLLLKDAYHAYFDGETRRTAIDAGSTLEIAFNKWIDERLSSESEQVQKALLPKSGTTLGPKLALMRALGWSEALDLKTVIQSRNDAAHVSASPSMRETKTLLNTVRRTLEIIYPDYLQLVHGCTRESQAYNGEAAAKIARDRFGDMMTVTYLGEEV